MIEPIILVEMVQNTTGDDSTETQTDATPDGLHELQERGCIKDRRVTVDPGVVERGGSPYQPDAEYLIAGTDQHSGNVLRGMLVDTDEGTYAYATRRNDCYNEDGSRPAWGIKDAGSSLTVTSVKHQAEYTPLDCADYDEQIDELHEWYEHDPDHVATVAEEALQEASAHDVARNYIEIADSGIGEFRVYYTLKVDG